MVNLGEQDNDNGVQNVAQGCYLSVRMCGKRVADKGELNTDEAMELFERLGVNLSLTTIYDPKAKEN